jgi:GNAT superfamily N-acetyltransferase
VSEPASRVVVEVTFLRMDQPPAQPGPSLPQSAVVLTPPAPTLGFYRYLYNTAGAAHLWWLRRVMPDDDLAALLRTPGVSLHVLYQGGEPAGFYELDARRWPEVNLSYFGLLPHAIGSGLGLPLLRHAVDVTWTHGARGMTVNTCTADHPRALPLYHRAGFASRRVVREVWDIPLRLGMTVPVHLRNSA